MDTVKRKRELKVYVWDDFMKDYTSGIAVAIAYDLRQARNLIRQEEGYKRGQSSYLEINLMAPHKVYPLAPIAFSVSGGS